jgi:hypothetical protein
MFQLKSYQIHVQVLSTDEQQILFIVEHYQANLLGLILIIVRHAFPIASTSLVERLDKVAKPNVLAMR